MKSERLADYQPEFVPQTQERVKSPRAQQRKSHTSLQKGGVA